MTRKITNNGLRKLVNECTRSMINENMPYEGTDKQNKFLRKLMGDKYDDKYDELSVEDTSKLIDFYLHNPIGNSRPAYLASEKQLNYLKTNKYYQLPWIDKIQDKLTKQDASELCSAVNPYNDMGSNYYGYRNRLKKEIWFPQMTEIVSEIAEKYGLSEEAAQIKSEGEVFTAKEDAKRQRAEAKRNKERLASSQVTIMPQDDNGNIEIDTDYDGATESLFGVYLDGKVEDEIGYDCVFIASDLSKMSAKDIEEETFASRLPLVRTCHVLGYDKQCTIICWWFPFGGRMKLSGLIVDSSDKEAYDKAMEDAKEHKGF